MADLIILLTLATFLLLAGMTLECVMRFRFWHPWAVFSWFCAMGFAWLLLADVLARTCDFVALAEAPWRSGVFRSLVFIGALQWMLRQPEWEDVRRG
jgi:hypothetical protein